MSAIWTDPAEKPAADAPTPVRLVDRSPQSPVGRHQAAASLIPSLDELAVDPARAAALPPDAAMDLLARCAVAQSALVGRLLASPSMARTMPDGQTEDRLLDVDEAADRLGTSADYLYRHSGKLPFTVRIGSRLRFSARGIDRFIRTRQGR